MSDIDALFARFLAVGFVVMRTAFDSGNREWTDGELELLHNVPSLMGESNVKRLEYFWLKERTHYIQFVSMPGREEAKSRMMAYYKPIWDEMEPLITRLIASASQPEAKKLARASS